MTAKPIHLGAAIAPALLQPSVPRPADFDAFWDAKLKALGEIPINPASVSTATGKASMELYTVKLDSLGSHVQGYLAKPAKEGKFPALVIFEWAGVHALQPETVTDRAAEGWLAFNVESHDIPPNQATGVATEYQAIGNTDRETSYFLNMYLRDSRAIDYIASRPDWDGKTIVVDGHQHGRPAEPGRRRPEPEGDRGDRQRTRRAPIPTAICTAARRATRTGLRQSQGHGNGALFRHRQFRLSHQGPRRWPRWVSSTRPSPPAGVWIALNQIPGPKEAIPMVDSEHNNLTPDKIGAFETRAKEVLDLILHGGEFKPNEELTRPK